MPVRPAQLLVILLPLALVATGCAAEIGDSCETNVECSPSGDRICDTAQAGGYCTVQGCSADSCPEEAACVAFFPTNLLSRACDPLTEDAVDPAVQTTDDCRDDEVCLSSGFCAASAQETRFCMRSCEGDGDCRDGYECRRTGTKGGEAVLDPTNPARLEYSYCAQRP
jgi:hypothetical protein